MKPLNLHQKEKLKEERRKKDEEEAKRLYNEFAESFESYDGKEPNHGKEVKTKKSKQQDPVDEPVVETCLPNVTVLKPSNVFFSETEDDANETVSTTGASINDKVLPESLYRRKRNLDLFLEEIKREHEGREEDKSHRQRSTHDSRDYSYRGVSSRDSDDEGPTTNLYVTGLPTTMHEEELARRFSLYGPVASVKILWPRTEEERLRGRNCGFVSFMKRRYAEDALKHMDGLIWTGGYEIRLCWGKAIHLPSRPFYVHPDWRESKRRESPPRRSHFMRSDEFPIGDTRSKKTTSSRNTSHDDSDDDRRSHSDDSYSPSTDFRYLDDNFEGSNDEIHHEEQDDFEYSTSDLSESEEQDDEVVSKGRLTRKQTFRWGHVLQKITCERDSISQAMYFAIHHADAADEVFTVLSQLSFLFLYFSCSY